MVQAYQDLWYCEHRPLSPAPLASSSYYKGYTTVSRGSCVFSPKTPYLQAIPEMSNETFVLALCSPLLHTGGAFALAALPLVCTDFCPRVRKVIRR